MGLSAHLLNREKFSLKAEMAANLITGFGRFNYQRNSFKVLSGFQPDKQLLFLA